MRRILLWSLVALILALLALAVVGESIEEAVRDGRLLERAR